MGFLTPGTKERKGNNTQEKKYQTNKVSVNSPNYFYDLFPCSNGQKTSRRLNKINIFKLPLRGNQCFLYKEMPALVRALNLMLERTIVCLEKVTFLIYEKTSLREILW